MNGEKREKAPHADSEIDLRAGPLGAETSSDQLTRSGCIQSEDWMGSVQESMRSAVSVQKIDAVCGSL